MKRASAAVRVTTVLFALSVGCALIASASGTDPLLIAEFAVLTLVGAWLTLLGIGARRAVADAERLTALSRPIDVAGHSVRLLNTSRPAAFVSGLLRPKIYVTRSLIQNLDAGELRGVVLHEQHHRRTWAPLRALALESWQRVLEWLPPARRALETRLATLEIEADAAAIAGGTEPATLASALVKCEARLPGVWSAFTAAAEIRIDELIAWGRQHRVDLRLAVPVEWVAPLGAFLTVWACHLIRV